MKKILLSVILAVAACVNVSGQGKVDRFVYGIERTITNIERTEKAFKRLGRAVGLDDRRGKVSSQYDYQTGIVTEYRYRELTSIQCTNVWMEVYPDRVAIYFPQDGQWVLDQIIYRNEFGTYMVTSGALCGNYRNIKIQVTVNRERTMIWFWHGEKTIKGFTVKTEYRSPWK